MTKQRSCLSVKIQADKTGTWSAQPYLKTAIPQTSLCVVGHLKHTLIAPMPPRRTKLCKVPQIATLLLLSMITSRLTLTKLGLLKLKTLWDATRTAHILPLSRLWWKSEYYANPHTIVGVGNRNMYSHMMIFLFVQDVLIICITNKKRLWLKKMYKPI